MRKFLTSFSIMAVFALSANAQDIAPTTPIDFKSKSDNMQMVDKEDFSDAQKQKVKERREKMASMTPEERKAFEVGRAKKEGWKERYNSASPEEKAKMDQRQNMMKNLTPEKKEALKQEMKRHREEMKKITGSEISGSDGDKHQ